MCKYINQVINKYGYIDDLYLAYRNTGKEDAKLSLFESLKRLASAVSVKYPTKYDPQGNAPDIYISMRNFALSYSGSNFLADVIENVAVKFA